MVIEQLNKLKQRFIFWTIIVFSFVIIFESYNSYQKYLMQIDSTKNNIIKQTQFIYNNKLDRLNHTLKLKLEALSESQQIKDALKQHNKNKLYQISKQKFTQIKHEFPYLTIMKYYLPNYKYFLRINNLNNHKNHDIQIQPIIKKAIDTKTIQAGYEKDVCGIKKLFYIVTYPIFDNKKLIGILEIGVDIQDIISKINEFFMLNTNSKIFTGFLLNNHHSTNKYQLFSGSKILNKIVSKISFNKNEQYIQLHNQEYFVFWNKTKIVNFNNQQIGTLIYAFDMTQIKNNSEKELFFSILKFIVILSLIYIAFLSLFKIVIYYVKLYNLKITNLVENQKAIIIVCRQEQIVQTNKSFLDFFNMKDLSEFTKNYNCICDKFKEEDGYIHKIIDNKKWIEHVALNPNKVHKVKMLDYKNKVHIFQVNAKKLENKYYTEYIATFEDITALEDINKNLEIKINEKTKELRQINNLLEERILEATLDIANQNSKLYESNNNFQNILDNTSEMIIFYDIQSMKIEDINKSAINILKYSLKNEIIGKNILDIIKDEDKEYFTTQEDINNKSIHILTKDDTIIDTITSTKIITKNGKKIKMLNMTDMTNFNKQKNYLNAVIESNNSAIIAINDQNEILTYNKKAEEIFGFSKEEMLGSNDILNIIPSKYKQLHINAFNNYFATGKSKGIIYGVHELEAVKKDGTIFPINISFGVDRSNKIVIANILDITQAKQQEKMIQQQTRLAQMGEMISMIAHQWRQPLGAISSAILSIKTKLEIGKFDFDDKDDREKYLKFCNKKYQNINDYVQFLSTTIDDFRNFFKPDKEKENVSLITPIQRALQIVSVSMKNKGINIIENYKCDEELIMYQNEVMQVVLNILKNAEDNFIEKSIPNPKIEINTDKLNDKYIISIKDNGGGIPKEIIPKIFDPYFSTKNEKNGTGLGLYMSKTIIEEHHNGELNVYNCDDGACFEIVFKSQ